PSLLFGAHRLQWNDGNALDFRIHTEVALVGQSCSAACASVSMDCWLSAFDAMHGCGAYRHTRCQTVSISSVCGSEEYEQLMEDINVLRVLPVIRDNVLVSRAWSGASFQRSYASCSARAKGNMTRVCPCRRR